MPNKALIQELHDKHIIDKRFVLWWQLGFEGRRIYTEEEFNQGLESITYEVEDPSTQQKQAQNYLVWIRDDVPILLRNINIGGINIPVFISVKPMSHRDGGGNGQRSLKYCKEFSFPMSIYHSPHVRGVVIEEKDNFLFWYPFSFGIHPEFYHTRAITLEKENMPCMINPIHPSKFYENLIKDVWNHGRRCQKRAREFDCKRTGFEIVPYFEFNPKKPHLAIYPVPIFQRKLELPVIIKSNLLKHPEILGVGYFSFSEDTSNDAANYWQLDYQKQRAARDTLRTRYEARS